MAGDVVTSEYKINFIAPARGELLIGRGEVIKVTGRQVITRADVFAVSEGTETLVATALATIAKLKS
jgi:acyl-coenzyme A thioesterase PaaI-like protein